MTDRPKGPYTRWTDGGYEGWSFRDFKTLEEAVHYQGYSSEGFVITRLVEYEIVVKPVPESPADD